MGNIMTRVFLDECYQDSEPIAVLQNGYNYIIWFKIDGMIIAFDSIYDNSPQYTLSVFTLEYAIKRYKELLKEGWHPIVKLEEANE